MFLVDRVLVSGRLFTSFFHCDPARCLGACCVQGDGRVPLEAAEAEALHRRQADVAALLDPAAVAVMNRGGGPAVNRPGEGASTPLWPAGGCLYARRSGPGRACWCLLEELEPPAKPVSCRLYPVRVLRRGPFEMLVYHRWDICAGAEALGRRLGTRLFRFARSGLVQRYGAGFYNRLEAQARLILPGK